MKLNQVVLGEAIEFMKSLPDHSIDAVITDPPYFKVKKEDWDRQWSDDREFLAWLDTVAAEWHRILKPNGSLYCFASPRMSARVEVMLSNRFEVLNHIIWNKTNTGGRHKASCKALARSFFPATESIIFCEHYGADDTAKGEAGYGASSERPFVFEPIRAYLDGERLKSGATMKEIIKVTGCFSVAGHSFRVSQFALPTKANYLKLQQAFPGCYERPYEELRQQYEELRRPFSVTYRELRRPFSVTADVPYTNVWEFPTVSFYPGKHSCEKPLSLMQHIILSSTRPGMVVLDPFMGSGSTAIACLETGRKFIGCELSPEYHALSSQRIERKMQDLKLQSEAA